LSQNDVNLYDVNECVAQLYDQIIDDTMDVCLLRRLIGGRGPLRILEPFCGTGRILIPLAEDGHTLVGIDQAGAMLRRAEAKLTAQISDRVTLLTADATAGGWPTGFDLVVLGGNCFYDLATPAEQQACIAAAAASLLPGGYLFLDNDHMEGELAESWRRPGVNTGSFPTGTCPDGTRLEGRMETIWYDAPRRLVRLRRGVTITFPDGRVVDREWVQQKHPVSVDEIRGWLAEYGFVVEQMLGDHAGTPYTDQSTRATFWARKQP
jgi:SAM-dependent methyltransferase